MKVEYLPVASSGAIFLLSWRSPNDVKLSRSLVIDLTVPEIKLKISLFSTQARALRRKTRKQPGT